MTTARSAAALAAAACLAVLAAVRRHGRGAGSGRHPVSGYQYDAADSRGASHDGARRPASAPRCHTSQLSLAFTGQQAAMGGQRAMTLILTDRSGATCSVYGYPGLAFSRAPASR